MSLKEEIENCDRDMLNMLVSYLMGRTESNIDLLRGINEIRGSLTGTEEHLINTLKSDYKFVIQNLNK